MISVKLEKVCIETKKGYECRFVPHSINTKMHWGKKHRWTEAWKTEVEWGIYKNRRKFKELPLHHARFEVVYHVVKFMDEDNLYASVKPIIDGLKKERGGVLIDDDHQHASYRVVQRKASRGDDQHVELRFYED